MDKVIIEDVQVVEDVIVELVSDLPEVDVNVKHSITAEVQPETYVIASQGYSAGVPGWVSNYIKDLVLDSIGTGSTLKDALDLIRTDLMGEIALGVSQAVTQIENAYVSNSALTTTLASEIGASRAAILDQVQTYADSTQAFATEVTALKASFGNADGSAAIEAFIGNIALSYANSEYARAETVTTLEATYNNDVSPKLESVDFVVSGYFPEWDGISTPEKGMYKVVAGIHYTYVGGTLGDNGWIKGSLAPYSYADAAVSLLETTTGVNLDQLQGQIDGVIDSWYYNYLPDQAELPWSTWIGIDTANTNTDEQVRHLGDLFYDLVTGTSYRFALTGSVFGWAVVTDTAITLALKNASTAQYTADGKAAVYYRNTLPTPKVVNGVTIPLELGDIWVNSDTGITKVSLIDNPTLLIHWSDITNTSAQNALIGLGILEETNDGVVYTFYQISAPTSGMSYGDWWIDTDASPIIAYRYQDVNGKSVGAMSWVNESNSILGKAMIEADTAKKNIAKVVDGTLVINATNATVNGSTLTTYVAAELDKEVVILSGTATPTTGPTTPTGKLNDIYIQKGTATGISGVVVDVVNTWKHNGTIWVAIGSNSNLTALADLTDGKRTIYSNLGTNPPSTGVELNDMWIPSSNSADGTTYKINDMYIYKAAGWTIATKYTDDTMASTAVTNAATAQTTANTASANATAALNKLTDIASDNILSPVEKSSVISEYTVITTEQSGIGTQATNYGITTEKTTYDNAVTALTTYLNTLTLPVSWNNNTGDTTIVGTTFRSKFNDVYTTRQALLNAISAKAKVIADAAALTATWSSVSSRPTSLATLNSADGTALSNATTAISDIASDSILSAVEKSSVRKEWNTIVSEKASIENSAMTVGVTTEKTAYVSAIVSLGTYMNSGAAWVFSTTTIPIWINDASIGINTAIVGATFRTNFTNYYTARQNLVTAIDSALKVLADTAQTTANAMTATYFSAAVPVIGTHPYLSEGDQWIPPANTGIYKINTIYTYLGGEWKAVTTESAENARNGDLYNGPESVNGPAQSPLKNDIWVVTDRYYVDPAVTIDTVSYTLGQVVTFSGPPNQEGKYKRQVKVYDGTAWIGQSLDQSNRLSAGWLGGASKLLYAPDGAVTGWEFADGSGSVRSEFKINAKKFSISNGVLGSTAHVPFEIVGTDIKFKGKVEFSSISDASTSIPTISSVTTAQSTATTANSNALARPLPSEVAAAINNNTTTIDGGKITTDTVQANRLTSGGAGGGGFELSGNYMSKDIAGAWRSVNVYGGGIGGANIYGGDIIGTSITGGTITSTTLDSSTIKVKDLQVVTDAGQLTSALHATSLPYSSSNNTIPLNVAAYNNTSTSLFKLASASNNRMILQSLNGNSTNHVFSGSFKALVSYYVRVKSGTTVLATKTIGTPGVLENMNLNVPFNLIGITGYATMTGNNTNLWGFNVYIDTLSFVSTTNSGGELSIEVNPIIDFVEARIQRFNLLLQYTNI